MMKRIKMLRSIVGALLMVCLVAPSWGQDDLILSVSDGSANPGETVEIDVTTENFVRIQTMTFSLFWDESVIEFEEVTNLNGDAGFSMANFSIDSAGGVPNPGELLVSWNQISGQDLEDGSVLFTVVYRAVGTSGDESIISIDDPSNEFQELEVIQLMEGGGSQQINVTANNGLVSILGEDGNVKFIASNESGDNGTEVCVKISVENYDNVAGNSLSIEYDPSIISFVEAKNFNTDGLDATGINDQNGVVVASWDDNQNAVTESDGTVIFELCFDVVGSAGETSPISFTNSPVVTEVVVLEGGDLVGKTPDTEDGSVDVSGESFDGVEIVLGDVTINEDEEFCVPVIANGFEDIVTFGFRLTFDDAALEFQELRNFNLPHLSSSNFNTNIDGEISFVWEDVNVEGVTVPNGTVIFEICYASAIPCPATTRILNDESFPSFEAVNLDGESLNYAVRSSEVEVTCGFSIDPEVTEESCGEACDGAISLNIDGGVAPFEVNWNGPTSIPNGEQNPTGLCPGNYDVEIVADNGFTVDTNFTIESPNAFSVDNVDIEDEYLGNDGSISVSASGGSGDFSYEWSTDPPQTGATIEDLASGSYTVTITDNQSGCELIAGPYAVDLIFTSEVTSSDIECFGEENGEASVTVEGGSGTFSYDWSCTDSDAESVSGLSAGNCEVTVTDDETGREQVLDFSIGEPDEIAIDPSITDDDGTGTGAIDLNVSGGTPPYSYEWSNGANTEEISDLEIGLYRVTIVDDNGCESSFGPIAVTDGNLIAFISSSLDELNGFGVSCPGECDGFIDVLVYGGVEPYSIEWTDGAEEMNRTNLCSGQYAFTITDDEGVTAEESVDLVAPSEISVDVVDRACSNGDDGSVTVEANGGAGDYRYSWDGDTYVDSPVNDGLEAGSYTGYVRDANNCETQFEYSIQSCLDEDDECFQAIPVITPNGDSRNDQFVIRCAIETNNRLEIYDRFGRLMYEEENYTNTWEGVDGNGRMLEEGSYIWVLRVFRQNGDEQVEKGTVTIIRELR